MPWRLQAMKDVVACDKLRGAGKLALIRGFPNGETHCSAVSAPEYIGPSSEPREVNHLSTGRKRKKFDSVSSGERKRISPNSRASGFSGVVGQGPDQIRGVTNRVSR